MAGSFYTLLDITREAVDVYRYEQQHDPQACGDCGEPLRRGPQGELYCKFDGSVWEAGYRRVGRIDVRHV